MRLRLALATIAIWTGLAPSALRAGPISSYAQTTLVTNATDPDLINPWGISFSGTSPFWVSDNGTGKSTLYNSAGVKQGLVVTMPGADPITGQVFNGTGSFNGDTFLFASLAGNIDGWRGGLGTNAEQLSHVPGAAYTGLAITTAKDSLFAANFATGTIDQFTGPGAPIGSFTDPTLPAGFAPFNIQNVGGTFYVMFAKVDPVTHEDAPGPGNGFVDTFNPVTHIFTRLISNGALNSPWGVTISPSSFGPAGGDLLIGNFGDGTINAYSLSGSLIGTLASTGGANIVNDGLWGITFGNGGNGGSPNSLYLTAGINDEKGGLFARLDVVPEPATMLMLAGGLALLGLYRRRLFS